jgi:hypothetical protein
MIDRTNVETTSKQSSESVIRQLQQNNRELMDAFELILSIDSSGRHAQLDDAPEMYFRRSYEQISKICIFSSGAFFSFSHTAPMHQIVFPFPVPIRRRSSRWPIRPSIRR